MRQIYKKYFLILILLSGCGTSQSNSQNTINLPVDIATSESIQILEPTLQPTEIKTYPIVYLSSGEKNTAIDIDLRNSLDVFHENYGIEWNEIIDISSSNIASSATRVLFTFENFEALRDISLRFPQMTIVYLNQTDEYDGKSTSIGYVGNGAESTAFMAGYLTGIISREWRIAGIATNSERSQLDSFVNGVKYYCGLCNPLVPPFVEYPLNNIVDDSADIVTLRNHLRDYINNGVDIIYLSPTLVNEETVSAAIELGILLAINTKYVIEEASPIVSISGIAWQGKFMMVLETLFQNQVLEKYYSPLNFSFLSSNYASVGKNSYLDELILSVSVGDIYSSP